MERKSRCLKSLVCIVSFLTLALFFVSCNNGKSENGTTAIKVNGQQISEKEFESLLQRELKGVKAQFQQFGKPFDEKSEEGKNVIASIKKRLSEDIVERLMILDAAEKADIQIADAEVEEQLSHVKGRFGDEGFENFKKDMGVDDEYIKNDLSKQMLIAKYVESLFKDIKIEDGAIEEHFRENIDKYNQPEMVRASHILLKTEKEAKEIRKKVKAGEDFSELAFNNSIDPSAKQNRGDLNYFPRGVMDKTFEEAAFSMPVGSVSEPVKTRFGYHIIKVIDKKAPQKATLENSRDKIIASLSEEKRKEIIGTKIAELRKTADIEVNVKIEGVTNDKDSVGKE